MQTLLARWETIKQSIGGNREKTGFEFTFGQPKEEFFHVTMPAAYLRRIISEALFAIQLSGERQGEFDALIDESLRVMENALQTEGAISRQAAMQAEDALLPISSAAKEYEILCAAHAHIDMNWMWTWHETVGAALATFRTMLDLMREYPHFTFSQSQASVYRIVEEYDPEMMKEIQERIREGRWEVTATAWVETDKNMPSTESLLRHIRETRDYMRDVWGVPAEALEIDFSPDTFGHSANVPEIDSYGAVKYLYHCRGLDEEHVLYRWRGISGKEVLAYREPYWYNSGITPDIGCGLLDRLKKCAGLKTGLIVYGVGDHGGGPTRRDVERILEMQDWPVWPKVSFGTFREFFHRAEAVRENLPLVAGEMNCFAPGCFTTQSRIKLFNRRSEAALLRAERLSALAGRALPAGHAQAWRKVLFTHFHDIITGSCTPDSREYAMAQYSEALAAAQTEQNAAMRAMAEHIDSSMFAREADISQSQSEGAGVGYGLSRGVPNPERGAGKTRVYHLFNSCAFKRKEAVELTLWDWTGNLARLVAVDEKGERLPLQLLDREFQTYWDHKYVRLLVTASVPALGYATIALQEGECEDYPVYHLSGPRTSESYPDIVLENACLRAVIRSSDGALTSLVDKKTGSERIARGACAGLVLYHCEKATNSAWVIGRRMKKERVDDMTELRVSRGEVRQQVEMRFTVMGSSVKACLSLDQDACALRLDYEVDWNERASKQDFVPVLGYELPLGEAVEAFECDVPAGSVVRGVTHHDIPALTHAAALCADGHALALVSEGKYGFTNENGALGVTLINTSESPDPAPERHVHDIRLWLAVSAGDAKALGDLAEGLNNPFPVTSAMPHAGKCPACAQQMGFEAKSCRLSAILPEEDGIVARFFETNGQADSVKITFPFRVARAQAVDLMGNPLPDALSIEGDAVRVSVQPYSIGAVRAYAK